MADEVKKRGEVEKPSESSEKKPKDKKKTLAKVTRLFWVALAILIFLLLFSILILSARIYKYAKLSDEGRTIAISADSVEHFNIFSAEYKNGKGQVVIQSADGDPVIAPGAKNDYTIRIKNEDSVAVDYTFKPRVEYKGDLKIPLELRLISPDEEYLIGSPKEWGTFDDFAELDYMQTLPKGAIHTYELQWRWLFESGDDEHDTALGNNAEGSGISVSLELHNEANMSSSDNGGLYGLGINDMLWFLIFFILLLIAIILLILSLIRRREPEPEPVVVFVPEPTPEPQPQPVVIPTPTPKKKQKGFVGKMAYVNIDTLEDNFNSGDTVSLKILKDKGLVDPKATQVKILARTDNVLDKVLHIETQGISAQARQKIIAAGGTIKITEG